MTTPMILLALVIIFAVYIALQDNNSPRDMQEDTQEQQKTIGTLYRDMQRKQFTSNIQRSIITNDTTQYTSQDNMLDNTPSLLSRSNTKADETSISIDRVKYSEVMIMTKQEKIETIRRVKRNESNYKILKEVFNTIGGEKYQVLSREIDSIRKIIS